MSDFRNYSFSAALPVCVITTSCIAPVVLKAREGEKADTREPVAFVFISALMGTVVFSQVGGGGSGGGCLAEGPGRSGGSRGGGLGGSGRGSRGVSLGGLAGGGGVPRGTLGGARRGSWGGGCVRVLCCWARIVWLLFCFCCLIFFSPSKFHH